jgi:hypothetical protein
MPVIFQFYERRARRTQHTPVDLHVVKDLIKTRLAEAELKTCPPVVEQAFGIVTNIGDLVCVRGRWSTKRFNAVKHGAGRRETCLLKIAEELLKVRFRYMSKWIPAQQRQPQSTGRLGAPGLPAL